MSRILLLGDFSCQNDYATVHCALDMDGVDIVLMNLETPFPSGTMPRAKAGPVLKGNVTAFSQIVKSNFIVTLANNHIMDFGEEGLQSTIRILEENKIRFCGIGATVDAARMPIVVETGNTTVGIIACCEAQFGVARHNQAGVAEFGPWVYKSIHNLRQKVDAVIVTVHAAIEDSCWPSPFIRELYQSFIDAGASVVHGHHSHVPQGYETYGKGLIFYGMGNFLVDPGTWSAYRNGMWSLSAELELNRDPKGFKPCTLEIRSLPGFNALRIEQGSCDEQDRRQRYLNTCNDPLKDPVSFEALWQEVALRAYHRYGARCMHFLDINGIRHSEWIGKGVSIFKNTLGNLLHTHTKKKSNHLTWYHMFSCESHRQMMITALGVLSGEIKDLRNSQTHRLADEMIPWPRQSDPL